MTALHCVTRNNDTEIVRLLLQYSADPNICDKVSQLLISLLIYFNTGW